MSNNAQAGSHDFDIVRNDLTVGIVGLGVMGRPIAQNLLRRGFRVAVWNRSKPPMDELEAAGAVPAVNLADLGERSAVVITVLPDPETAREVALGPSGLIASQSPGDVLIDMSTGDPFTAMELFRAGSARDVAVLDAPMSGGEEGAVNSDLSIMIGGSDSAVRRVTPILETLGTIVHVGGPGTGQIVKAANQMVVAGSIGVLAEAILLLERAQVDPIVGLRAMSRGMAYTRVMEMRGANMVRRSFVPGARANLHLKDLRIALEIGESYGVVYPHHSTARAAL